MTVPRLPEIVSVEAVTGAEARLATTTGLVNNPFSSDCCSVNIFPAVNTPVVEKVSEIVELEQRFVVGDTFAPTVMVCACTRPVITRLLKIVSHAVRKRVVKNQFIRVIYG